MTAPGPAAVPDNPFVPPGNEEDPDGPLNPADNGEHRDWYIDEVAEHGSCFADYQDLVRRRCEQARPTGRPPSRPPARFKGQLLVVEGPEGSGKTSLVNRMVDWTGQELARVGLTAVPVDLRQVESMDETGAVRTGPALQRAVCRELLDRADWFGRSPFGQRADAMFDRNDEFNAGSFYRLISQSLDTDQVLLVLPPGGPSDTSAQHLERYDSWASAGILFLAERITIPGSETLSPTSARNQHSVPMRTFALRGLREGEASTVVSRRLRGLPRSARCPDVPAESLARLEAFKKDPRFNTIGWVLKTFREIFARRAASSPGTESVGWDEIAEHLLAGFLTGEARR